MRDYKPDIPEPLHTTNISNVPTDDMRYTFLISLAICATLLVIISIFAMRRSY